MGTLACYLDPQDLGAYLQDPALCLALLQQLAQCTSEGFISESGRVSRPWTSLCFEPQARAGSAFCVLLISLSCFLWQLHSWLIPAVENISSTDPLQLSALSSLLPQLGAPFLLSLPSQLLFKLLSQPGIHRYSPAQVSSIYLVKCLQNIFYFFERRRWLIWYGVAWLVLKIFLQAFQILSKISKDTNVSRHFPKLILFSMFQ